MVDETWRFQRVCSVHGDRPGDVVESSTGGPADGAGRSNGSDSAGTDTADERISARQ